MRKVLFTIMAISLLFTWTELRAEEVEVLFGFETGLQGWEIPDWAFEKPDHVQKEISQSEDFASEGKNSLKIDADFPGEKWTGAIIEIMQSFDFTDYKAIECDVYIPEDAPLGLKGSMILTVGDTWKWVEMSRSFDVIPGEWVTISGDLMPGSIDWRRVQVDDAFRKDIRKIDLRVFSNNKPAYTGPIYIDNVRVSK
ncbi:MAG: glycan-binding surface protein [Candidatus Omnitrophota bacterium]